MKLTDAVLVLLWLALTAYVVLAGADFGGGVWDALAHGPTARGQRRAIAEAMGPVWEANHVWLIALITGLFTCFPPVFAALSIALYVPLSLALIGIVLRGAAFAFRAHGREAVGSLTPWGAIFGATSIVTPFFLGASASAIGSGAIRVHGTHVLADPLTTWLTPFGLDCGFVALALAAQQAAVYLSVEAWDAGDDQLEHIFGARALVALMVTVVLAAVGLPLMHAQAPILWSGFVHRALPLVALTGLLALGCGVSLLSHHVRRARIFAVGEAIGILWAWAAAQYPYLVVPDLTVRSSAATSTALLGFIIIAVVGGVFLIPALLLLFAVFKGHNPAETLPVGDAMPRD